MSARIRIAILILGVVLLGGLLWWGGSAAAAPLQWTTPAADRPGPPPTIYPPAQGDNGAQVYWGMCQDCHGDQGQGLTAAWRSGFAPEYQNCWEAGCHGENPPAGSFTIPAAGAPSLAGPGALPQFPTAFELGSYIYQNMPLFPTGSLSEDQAWELTAYLMDLNGSGQPELTLKASNSAALPIHRGVALPEKPLPWVLAAGLLTAAGAGFYRAYSREIDPHKKPGNFFHHLHPATIPAEQSRFNYTLGAGGLSIFFCLVLLLTGALELYYYQPTPAGASASIQALDTLVPYGAVVRSLHFWSAQLLVLTLMVHLGRIILTGAYAPPRRFNYLLGLSLLVVALLLDFTGYLLRWDEGIRWALVVGTNLLKTIPGIGEGLYRFVLGGSGPGSSSLLRFYSWHIYGLTLVFAGLTAWHVFRVRRDGGISAPAGARRTPQDRIPRSQLVRQEVLAVLAASAVLLLIGALVPAPIDRPLDPQGNLAGDAGAPWFFLWIQATLKLGDPFLWGVLVPLLAVAALGLLPYILPNAGPEELGRWLPAGNRAGQIVGLAVIGAIFILTILGWLS